MFLRPMFERDLSGVLKASLESIDIRVGVHSAVTLRLTVVAATARVSAIRGTSEESMSIVRLTGNVRLMRHMKETGPQKWWERELCQPPQRSGNLVDA